jgi:hypothetical protein
LDAPTTAVCMGERCWYIQLTPVSVHAELRALLPAALQRNLLVAAVAGEVRKVQRGLDGGVDVNCRDEVGALTLWEWMYAPLCDWMAGGCAHIVGVDVSPFK